MKETTPRTSLDVSTPLCCGPLKDILKEVEGPNRQSFIQEIKQRYMEYRAHREQGIELPRKGSYAPSDPETRETFDRLLSGFKSSRRPSTFGTGDKRDSKALSVLSNERPLEYPDNGNDDWYANQLGVIMESHHEFSKSENILSLMDDHLKEKHTNSYEISASAYYQERRSAHREQIKNVDSNSMLLKSFLEKRQATHRTGGVDTFVDIQKDLPGIHKADTFYHLLMLGGTGAVEIKQEKKERFGPLRIGLNKACLLYTSPSPRDGLLSRMPSSA
eukprot:TRINITY_DN8533_c0_g3_i1.p2 TRINITY_DN8533_c0_g3~~TRINITY_DN8533_c0_g3_i1.p2  ORF type:complete len:275 (+),score=50.68 TRINITY_DN8533_c0_g3_i1:921-1745(+)